MLLHVKTCLASNVFCVIALWTYNVEIIWLQQKFIVLVKRWWYFPLPKVFACVIWFFFFFFFALKVISSNKATEKFPFKGNNRGILKNFLSLDSVCKICQFLLILCLRSSRVTLKVTNQKSSFLSFFVWFFHSLE